MRTLAVSVHLDDLVLSCGQYLDETFHYGEAYAWTALAGIPPEGTATGYDTSTGWCDSVAAVEGRRQEDTEAMKRLGINPLWGELLDSQYGYLVTPTDVAAGLLGAIAYVQPDLLIVPVGIRHPDHIAVGNGCLDAIMAGYGPEHVLLYEDLPYRVMYPDEAVDRVRRAATSLDGRLDFEAPPEGELAVKQEAVAQYRSQMIALEPDLRCCWVPERFHRVTT